MLRNSSKAEQLAKVEDQAWSTVSLVASRHQPKFDRFHRNLASDLSGRYFASKDGREVLGPVFDAHKYSSLLASIAMGAYQKSAEKIVKKNARLDQYDVARALGGGLLEEMRQQRLGFIDDVFDNTRGVLFSGQASRSRALTLYTKHRGGTIYRPSEIIENLPAEDQVKQSFTGIFEVVKSHGHEDTATLLGHATFDAVRPLLDQEIQALEVSVGQVKQIFTATAS